MNLMLANKYNPVKILLAEDDDDDQFFFNDTFTQLPFSVKISTVANGEKALQVLTTTPIPHVIFLDLNMPKLTGI